MSDLFGQQHPETRVDLDAQITELKRELVTRRHVYPRLIESGRMNASVALRQNRRLEAAIKTLEQMLKTSEGEKP